MFLSIFNLQIWNIQVFSPGDAHDGVEEEDDVALEEGPQLLDDRGQGSHIIPLKKLFLSVFRTPSNIFLP